MVAAGCKCGSESIAGTGSLRALFDSCDGLPVAKSSANVNLSQNSLYSDRSAESDLSQKNGKFIEVD